MLTEIKEPNINPSKDFQEIQKTIKEHVKDILLNDEKACQNDLFLCLKFWQKTGQAVIYGNEDNMTITFKRSVFDITIPESISRARRELHHDRIVSYDKETEKARERKEIEYKEYFHTNSILEEESPINTPF